MLLHSLSPLFFSANIRSISLTCSSTSYTPLPLSELSHSFCLSLRLVLFFSTTLFLSRPSFSPPGLSSYIVCCSQSLRKQGFPTTGCPYPGHISLYPFPVPLPPFPIPLGSRSSDYPYSNVHTHAFLQPAPGKGFIFLICTISHFLISLTSLKDNCLYQLPYTLHTVHPSPVFRTIPLLLPLLLFLLHTFPVPQIPVPEVLPLADHICSFSLPVCFPDSLVLFHLFIHSPSHSLNRFM